MKYKEWLKEWLEFYVKTSVKQRTYERYASILTLHVIPTLGEFELQELSPSLLQHFATHLLQNGNIKNGHGLSPNTVNAIITVLQNSLQTAYVFGKTTEYSANKIKRPKVAEKKITCFSLQEHKKIEHAIQNQNNDRLFGIILCLYTGLRIGELLALEWNDIDFQSETLIVNKSCYYGTDANGRYCRFITTPKTQASQRVIPLPKPIVSHLTKIKTNSLSELVINNKGKPIPTRSYQKSFETLLRQQQIPHHGFHALRHTFATRALECGMDVKTLSELLGHKNATLTLNRYTHSMIEHKKEVMNRIGMLY